MNISSRKAKANKEMLKMDKHIIYGLTNSDIYGVYYIGVSKDLLIRKIEHINTTKRNKGENKSKELKILEGIKDNSFKMIILDLALGKELAKLKESYWIYKFGLENLTNKFAGTWGDNNKINKYLSHPDIEKGLRVIAINLKTGEEEEFNYIYLAKKALKITSGGDIKQILQQIGNHQSTNGFTFSYNINKPVKKIQQLMKDNRDIIMTNMKTKKKRIFNNAREIMKELNLPGTGCIYSCLRDRIKCAYGYTFKYVEVNDEYINQI